MTKPKRDTLRDAVSQIMYCCSGDKEQYEETLNAVLGAVEVYIKQLTKTALQNVPNGASQVRIVPGNIIAALASDPRKQSFLYSILNKKNNQTADYSIH